MLRLMITPTHGKYVVTDEKNHTMYTIKKKLRGTYIIRDENKYDLYELSLGSEDRHPVYQILLNDKPAAELRCVSRFVDPRMELESGDILIVIRTDDPNHLRYHITDHLRNEVGRMEVITLPKGEYRFDIRIEEAFFDDYIPLMPIATVECIKPQSIST